MGKVDKTIAVIDLKAFYAFVECVDRGLDAYSVPLVVADKDRGKNTIVLSVTPYLKSKGVPSRLRIKDLPPEFDYIYAIPRMERYIEKSGEIVSIILEFVSYEDIHVYSIDEAFIDLTSYIEYYKKTPKEIIQMIIDTIKDRTGLTATAGIGENFFLSKVALDLYAKKEPDGIAIMHKEDVPTKLWPVTPLNKMWGIGERMMARLNAIGIYTVGDIARSNRDYIKSKFGVMGEQLIDHANGIDESDIHEEYVPKETSLSIGQVLFKDYNKENIVTIIREMNDDLCVRMRKQECQTSVVSLFIGYSKETMGGFSRQMSLLAATDDNQTLFEAEMEIFNKFIQDLPIRHVGINFGKLTYQAYRQLDIFEDQVEQSKRTDLNKAMDKIQAKYGKNALLRASALTEDSTIKERHEFIGGHRK